MVGRIQDEPAIQSIATYAAWRILAPPQIRRWYYNNNQRRPPPMEEPRDELVMGLIPWILQILKLFLLGTILLLASGASYAIFYRAVMPSRYATVALYFDYSPPVDMGVVPSTRPLFKLPKYPPKTHVVPTASVDLFAKHVAWDAFHQAVAPPLLTQNRLLSPRQGYYIEMLLFLPESMHNREAGLFGVVTDLQSSNQTTLARSTRWTQLPHESGWISFTRKLLCLPAFLVGALTEFRTIQLDALRHFVESRDFPLRYVTVALQRHSPQQVMVEVIRGELRIGKELNILQELLKEYYYTGFFIGTLSFAFLYLLGWSFLVRIMERLGFFRFWYGLEEPDCELDFDFTLGGGCHDEPTRMHEQQERDDEEKEQEPRFEDWHSVYEQSPLGTDRNVHVVPDSPLSSPLRDHFDNARANSEDDWEDIFYPATDREQIISIN